MPLDEIEPGDHFGHWMFNLEPGVHLHKVEAARGRKIMLRDEFNGACTDIPDRFRGSDCRLAHLPPSRLGHAWRRRFFNHFLVTTLQRAIAFEQINAVPEFVSKHLDLDVARTLQIALKQHIVVAERILRFTFRRRQRRGEFACRFSDFHAFAATTRTRLNQHRKANAHRLSHQ